MVRRTIHQRQELKSAMHQAHGKGVEVYDLGRIVMKRQAERLTFERRANRAHPRPMPKAGFSAQS